MRDKITEIQGLRGLAILMVVAFHFTVRWGSQITGGTTLYPFTDYPAWLYVFLAQGRLGVELFFLISGFVIALTLENSSGVADFWKKRFVRLWPPLLLCLPAIWIVLQFSPPLQGSSPSLTALLESLTLINPFIFGLGSIGQVTGVLWTLWVELQFYALAAGLYFCFRRFTRHLVAITFITFLLQVVGMTRFGQLVSLAVTFVNLGNYLTWFTAGVIAYKIRTNGRRPTLLWVYVCCGAMSEVALGTVHYTSASGLTIDGVGVGALITNAVLFVLFAAASMRSNFPPVKSVVLVFAGEISYELYLIHEALGMSLLQLMRENTHLSNKLLSIPVALLMGALAWLVYRFWSKPSMRWLRLRLDSPAKRVRAAGGE